MTEMGLYIGAMATLMFVAGDRCHPAYVWSILTSPQVHFRCILTRGKLYRWTKTPS